MCYIKSFGSILFLGNLLGVSQFTFSNSKYLVGLRWILMIPFLVGYLYLAEQSYKFSELELKHEEVVIVSMGIWIVFGINLLATLSRFPYYFLTRRLFKRVILDVNEINKRLSLAPKYTRSTMKIWLTFFSFVTANIFIRWCADMHWSLKAAFLCGGIMHYCEMMFAYKILNELALQCEHLHQIMFEGLDFLKVRQLDTDKVRTVTPTVDEGGCSDVKRRKTQLGLHTVVGEVNDRSAYFEKFLDLTEVHLKICQCAKSVNSVFGTPFMSLVILDFTVVTLTMYDLCNSIVELNLLSFTYSELIEICGFCIQIGVIFTRQMISIYSWTYLEKQLKETVLNIHKLWNELSINNQIGKWAGCIQLTTIQLSNAIPQFSASGLFDIDWPVIISIVSAASTYVVILIQFASIKRNVEQEIFPESSNGDLGAPFTPKLLFPA